MQTRLRPLVFALLPMLNLFALTLLTANAGCKSATIIGTACKHDGDCNVSGQVCAPGFNGGPSICTRKCTGQTGTTGCPIGYDCFPTDTTKGPTCTKALYEVDAQGNPLLFGVDCSSSDDVCAGLGSTNAAVTCRKVADTSQDPPVPVVKDPNAYCTGVCGADGDCPLNFTCATDYDGAKKCLRRRLCTPCSVDANCSSDYPICVATADGTSRYCTKGCNSTNDCGGVQNTALTCTDTTNAAGAAARACLHRYGACVGEGNICDPCRTKDDCAKSNSFCLSNIGTGERFCTKQCVDDSDCGGAGAGKVPSVCDNTDIATNKNPNGQSQEICNGDVDHITPGLLSCYLSPI